MAEGAANLMKTFYLAGSSKKREMFAGLANQLTEYGLRWFADWNWTKLILAEVDDPTRITGNIAGDVSAAIGCDVFILYTGPDDSRSMSWAEFGARLGQHKEAHVITNGYQDVFWKHPCVRTHETWEDFLEWLTSDHNLGLRRLRSFD